MTGEKIPHLIPLGFVPRDSRELRYKVRVRYFSKRSHRLFANAQSEKRELFFFRDAERNIPATIERGNWQRKKCDQNEGASIDEYIYICLGTASTSAPFDRRKRPHKKWQV